MKERPISFPAPLVRAILAGQKTQARFPIHPQPAHVWGWGVKHDEHDFCAHVRYPGGHQPDPWVRCPYGAPPHREYAGDRLWVREGWRHYPMEGHTVYRADGEEDVTPLLTWRSAMHMPRHLSRITLEITSIRVERLCDISAPDALAEGCGTEPCNRCDESGVSEDDICEDCAGEGRHSEVQVFRMLWDAINKRHPWSTNPWVWVVSFAPS